MACGTHTQTVLDRFIEVANGKAAHELAPGDCNEIIVINHWHGVIKGKQAVAIHGFFAKS
jgi:hypothetical protein